MPRRSRTKQKAKKRSRSGTKRKRKRKLKRRHKTDALTHAKRRHARSRNHTHKARMVREVETVNALLTQLLQTASSTESKPYHFDKRHHTKDPEYAWSNENTQKFKRGFPAPDVNFWRPQGENLPPSRGNYPNWTELVD